MGFQDNLRERVLAGMRHWRDGDMDKVMEQYVEDAVFSSPNIARDGHEETLWLQGRDEIRAHLEQFRRHHPVLDVREIFIGRGFYTLLFGGEMRFTMHVEPDENGLTRRLTICRSIGAP